MNKYRAQKVVYDGIVFASHKEGRRYQYLKLLEKAKEISGLQMQVKHELIPPQRDEDGKYIRAVYYVSDFEYIQDGRKVVEDVKGFRTKEYKLKKKLLLFREGITIREV